MTSLLALSLALAGTALPAAANTHVTHICPAQLRLNSATVTVNPPAPAFTPSVSDMPLALTGASAFDGPPEQGAALKPVSDKRSAGGSTTVWHFEGSFEAGKWLSCDYAQGLVRLAVQVDAAATRCEARTAAAKAPARVTVTLACR